MIDDRTVSLRICQEGHANALALNKESTQIAVAGRSCKYFRLFYMEGNTKHFFLLLPPSAQGVFN
jgi:hypothetical protein